MRTKRVWMVLSFLTLLGATTAHAVPISLGTAQSFAVLGATTVTNTGPTTIHGDIGVSPGSSYTGSGSVTQTGGVPHVGDAVAANARAASITAYNALAGLVSTIDLTGMDLGNLVLTSGVYKFSSSAQLTGNLTLDYQGNANSAFVFQIGSTLTTASGSTVSAINGGSGSGLFWQVGSSATLGTGSTFAGNLIALTSITMTTSAKILCGRAIALNAAVTMDTNTISDDCTNNLGSGKTDFGSGGFKGGSDNIAESPTIPGTVTVVPEPATLTLMAIGGLVGIVRKRRQEATALRSS